LNFEDYREKQLQHRRDRERSAKRQLIVFGIVLVICCLAALPFLPPIKTEPDVRRSPDGTGWYKDSGLTNAQMLEIAAKCKEQPNSWRCR
jgi:hypothetical protein